MLFGSGREASRLLAAQTPDIEAAGRRDAVRRWRAAMDGGLTGEAAAKAVAVRAPRFTAGNGSRSDAPHGRIVFAARIGRARWFVRSSGCARIIRCGAAPSSVRSCGRKALRSPTPPSGASSRAWWRAVWSIRFPPCVGAAGRDGGAPGAALRCGCRAICGPIAPAAWCNSTRSSSMSRPTKPSSTSPPTIRSPSGRWPRPSTAPPQLRRQSSSTSSCATCRSRSRPSRSTADQSSWPSSSRPARTRPFASTCFRPISRR